MTSDSLGMYLVLALYLAGALVVLLVRLPTPVKLVLLAGLLMRPLGATLRWAILQFYYNGSGDASRYFGRGRTHAALLWQGAPDPFWDVFFRSARSWQGTRFVEATSAMVVSVIGPTKVGAFMFFGLFAMIGLVAFGVAFARACPEASAARYLGWILLFPSLLYWPSSVGKEAIILMGLGLATMGFIGKRGRINWGVLLIGIFFVYAVRAEVAAVTVMSFAISHWLSFSGRWTAARAGQAMVIAVASVVGLTFFLRSAGVEALDADGLTQYVESSTGRDLQGGSAIEAVDVSVWGLPVALVNTTLRPFPWEAGSSLAFLSGIEIWALWGILWLRRRNVLRALREWRSNPLLRIALPFIILYSVALGMMLANLGVIARQRVFIFPFLFLLAEALPHAARAGARTWQTVRARQPRRLAAPGPEEVPA
jgi:hypothetical protein